MASTPRRGRQTLIALSAAAVTLLSSAGATATTDALGDELWVARYHGPPIGGIDSAEDVAVSPDGSKVYVTGASDGESVLGDYATLAYDAATGAQLWVRRFDGNGGGDEAYSVGVSPDGTEVFVTGTAALGAGSGDIDWMTIAYDAATGLTLWERHNGFHPYGVDRGCCLVVSPDGSKVFVTGSIETSYDNSDYATLAYDARTGATVWLRRFNGPRNGSDIPASLALSPDGSTLFVTGESLDTFDNWDYATVAYDAPTGSPLWTRKFSGPGQRIDSAYDVTVSPDGSRVYVTGVSESGTGSYYDYATVAYGAANGDPLWLARYDGSGHDADYARAVSVSPDGSKVFVTGHVTNTGGTYDFATLAYDAESGAALWLRQFDGPGHGLDIASDCAVSPDGTTLFVTGSGTRVQGDTDYVTIAYDTASGSTLWHGRYNDMHGSYDSPTALAVAPNGAAVYVTGDSADWYGTVAYAAR